MDFRDGYEDAGRLWIYEGPIFEDCICVCYVVCGRGSELRLLV